MANKKIKRTWLDLRNGNLAESGARASWGSDYKISDDEAYLICPIYSRFSKNTIRGYRLIDLRDSPSTIIEGKIFKSAVQCKEFIERVDEGGEEKWQ